MTEQTMIARPDRPAGLRCFLCIACVLVLAAAGARFVAPTDPFLAGPAEATALLVLAAALAYVLAMAVPFVPGIEIGLAVMLVLGWKGILLVYLCTQLALALSFLVGRCVPARAIAAALGWLRLERAQRMVVVLDRTPPEQRVALLAGHSTVPWRAALLRHRHLALAVVLNLPGNAVLGGAGGIGLVAGLSRAYRFPRYAFVVAAATTPVPLFLLLTGMAQ